LNALRRSVSASCADAYPSQSSSSLAFKAANRVPSYGLVSTEELTFHQRSNVSQ
jgi:hypothetical protein